MYTPAGFLLGFALLVSGQAELTVQTTKGPVVGFYDQLGFGAVRAWLGIPYAKAPIGDLRFAPPVAADSWTAPLNATAFGPSCIQSRFTAVIGEDPPPIFPTPAVESEDCLSINVWAPTTARSASGNAVLLWVYGGGFTQGYTANPIWPGTHIVRDQQNVIVVSFNYRLNVFGYPNIGGLPGGNKNPGLLDVRAAVEWTKNNIANFGGDPNKITLFGESAGGAAVDAYTFFSASDPIIKGAITQSGTIEMPLNGVLGNPSGNWAALSAAVGCPSTPAATSLACMRALPALTLRDKINELDLSFIPTPDDKTVFSNHLTRLRLGQYAKIPVLTGSNQDEIPGVPSDTAWAFTCPAARTARNHFARVPTWQYRFFGTFPGFLGPVAHHGAELSLIFGTIVPDQSTPQQIAASQYMQGAWAAFAKNPASGLSSAPYNWPTWNPLKPTLVRLAYNNTVPATYVLPATFNLGSCQNIPGNGAASVTGEPA